MWVKYFSSIQNLRLLQFKTQHVCKKKTKHNIFVFSLAFYYTFETSFANDVCDDKICQNNENYYNNMRKWLLSLPAEYQGWRNNKYTLLFEMESFRYHFLIFLTFATLSLCVFYSWGICRKILCRNLEWHFFVYLTILLRY